MVKVIVADTPAQAQAEILVYLRWVRDSQARQATSQTGKEREKRLAAKAVLEMCIADIGDAVVCPAPRKRRRKWRAQPGHPEDTPSLDTSLHDHEMDVR